MQEILGRARRIIDILGEPPHPAHWHEALAGIRNVANEADAAGLAVEEGGVTSTHMAITTLLAAVDRTTTYLDHMLADAARGEDAGRPPKRRKGDDPNEPRLRDPRQALHRDLPLPRALPLRPARPVSSEGPEEHDRRALGGHPRVDAGESTPYQILRAQQILERLMPFFGTGGRGCFE